MDRSWSSILHQNVEASYDHQPRMWNMRVNQQQANGRRTLLPTPHFTGALLPTPTAYGSTQHRNWTVPMYNQHMTGRPALLPTPNIQPFQTGWNHYSNVLPGQHSRFSAQLPAPRNFMEQHFTRNQGSHSYQNVGYKKSNFTPQYKTNTTQQKNLQKPKNNEKTVKTNNLNFSSITKMLFRKVQLAHHTEVWEKLPTKIDTQICEIFDTIKPPNPTANLKAALDKLKNKTKQEVIELVRYHLKNSEKETDDMLRTFDELDADSAAYIAEKQLVRFGKKIRPDFIRKHIKLGLLALKVTPSITTSVIIPPAPQERMELAVEKSQVTTAISAPIAPPPTSQEPVEMEAEECLNIPSTPTAVAKVNTFVNFKKNKRSRSLSPRSTDDEDQNLRASNEEPKPQRKTLKFTNPAISPILNNTSREEITAISPNFINNTTRDEILTDKFLELNSLQVNNTPPTEMISDSITTSQEIALLNSSSQATCIDNLSNSQEQQLL